MQSLGKSCLMTGSVNSVRSKDQLLTVLHLYLISVMIHRPQLKDLKQGRTGPAFRSETYRLWVARGTASCHRIAVHICAPGFFLSSPQSCLVWMFTGNIKIHDKKKKQHNNDVFGKATLKLCATGKAPYRWKHYLSHPSVLNSGPLFERDISNQTVDHTVWTYQCDFIAYKISAGTSSPETVCAVNWLLFLY